MLFPTFYFPFFHFNLPSPLYLSHLRVLLHTSHLPLHIFNTPPNVHFPFPQFNTSDFPLHVYPSTSHFPLLTLHFTFISILHTLHLTLSTFQLQTSQFSFVTSHFTLPLCSSSFIINFHTPHLLLHTSLFISHIPHFSFVTSHFPPSSSQTLFTTILPLFLHTSLFTSHIPHFSFVTSHFTLHFSLPTSHLLFHTSHFLVQPCAMNSSQTVFCQALPILLSHISYL